MMRTEQQQASRPWNYMPSAVEELGIKAKVRLVLHKLSPMTPEDASGKLIWAVVEQAVRDLAWNADVADEAKKYLCGPMWHASLVGIDPDYVRRVIRQVGIEL